MVMWRKKAVLQTNLNLTPRANNGGTAFTVRNAAYALHALGLIEDPHCNCHQPAEDTVQHVLYTCTKYNAFRRPLQVVAQIKDVVWPPELRFWTTKDAYPVVRKYITRVLRLREEEELRRRLQAR